ncbi:MAG: hypothetical protein R3F05_15655 [Planctomycetota bacterium]|nr:hypothetical protein [Planctomycetota bacterium]MCB9901524.1 hypothetical protein [Planctomycetota bacterium]
MRVSAIGSVLVVAHLGLVMGTQAALGSEPDTTPVQIEARLDGKTWKQAPVRVAEVTAHVSSTEQQLARALTRAYAQVHAPSTKPETRTDDKGRAQLTLPARGMWMVCVGEGREAWTCSVRPGGHDPGSELEVRSTSEPVRLAMRAAVPDGWLLVVSRKALSAEGVIPMAIARPEGDDGTYLLDGMEGGVLSLDWMHPLHGAQHGDALTVRPGDVMIVAQAPAASAGEALRVAVVVDGSAGDVRVDVGDRDPRLARLQPSSGGTFTSRDDHETALVPRDAYNGLRGMRAYAQAPGRVPAFVQLEPATSEGADHDLTARIKLEPGQPVAGKADWAAGLVEGERWVAVRAPDAPDTAPGPWFLIQPDGSFRTALPPGRWMLDPLHAGAQGIVVDVGPSGAQGVVLPPASPRTLTGRIVLPGGGRAQDAVVHAVWGRRMDSRCTRPDKNGQFAVEVPPDAADEVTLVVRAPRCSTVRQSVGKRVGDIGPIELPAGGAVRVEAKDGRGDPLSDWVLLPKRVREDPLFALDQAVVDYAGVAELTGLAAGRHDFTAICMDMRMFDVTVDVKEGRETKASIALPPTDEPLLLAPDLPTGTASDDLMIAARVGTSLLGLPAFVADAKGRLRVVHADGLDALLVLAEHAGRLLASPPLARGSGRPGSIQKLSLTPYEPGTWEAVCATEDGSGRAVFPTSITMVVDSVRPSGNPYEEQQFGERVSTRRMFDVHPRVDGLRVGNALLLSSSEVEIMMEARLQQNGEAVSSKRLVLRDFVSAAGKPVDLAPAVVELPAPTRVRVRSALPLRMAVTSAGGVVRDAVVEVQLVLPGEVSYREGALPRVLVPTDALGVATLRDRPQDMDLLVRVIRAAGHLPQAEPVTIASSQNGRIELRVDRAAEATVTLLDKSGQPVPSVTLYVWDADAHTQRDPKPVATGTTDAEGKVRLGGLSAEARYQIDVEDDRFGSQADWLPGDATLRAVR